MTEEGLARLIGRDRARVWLEPVRTMLAAADATSPLRASHLLAQVLHESAGFTVLVENMNYSAARLQQVWPTRFTPELARKLERQPARIANHVYGGRLGNTQPGDGWRFRGRGLIQLTGRSNYQAYQNAGGGLVVGDPDLAAEPMEAARIAAWYWSSRNLNALADLDDVRAVTVRVNGGTHGLADRKRWQATAFAALQAPIVATPVPDRVGEFDIIVMHGLNVSAVLAALDALLDGDGTATVGAGVASKTARGEGWKLDVRLTS